VADAIKDVSQAFHQDNLKMEDRWFNIKTMKTLEELS
jgi:hypothetical protein